MTGGPRPLTGNPDPAASARAAARRRRAELLGRSLLRLCLAAATAPVCALLGWLLATGLPAVDLALLLTGPADMMHGGGIAPALAGSIALVGLAAAIAVPAGVAAAIHVTWYAPSGAVARLLHGLAETMAAVPSVIFGLFGLVVFVRGLGLGISWLAGSLTLAVLMLPLLAQAGAAALRDVPADTVAASLALGATRWQTLWHVALPAAAPGLLAAIVLAAARAAGETAPVLFTAAAFFRTGIPASVLHQTMTLPTHLYLLVTQVPDAAASQLAGTALGLLVLSLGLMAVGLRLSYGRQALSAGGGRGL